jgi:hypothetical protein
MKVIDVYKQYFAAELSGIIFWEKPLFEAQYGDVGN